MSYNLISDISLLTTIPLKTLCKLTDKSVDCICNNVYESLMVGGNSTPIDIGIGKLYININNNGVNYNFIPSKDLEEKLTYTIKNNSNPLILSIEESLTSKILNTYKDLI